ncbi:triosephosphate isomerase [Candidatus Gottesmanbacteria bacterium]|nr:triosephosphate isomerase [Candidatus Gottesmanbacteria bacterium]
MKKLFIAGNWKSNKGIVEAQEWLQSFKSQISNHNDQLSNICTILCAPFTLLYLLKQEIDHLHISIELGAQDVSPYDVGAYTGEVSASQIKEFARWVIIGHSERRKYFLENDAVLQKKVEQAKSVGLQIIYCVPDESTSVPSQVDVVAYEPIWAIGTGKTDTPENANRVIQEIKSKTKASVVIYGGSVTADNVASFVSQESIHGVLPGGASLDPEKFYKIITRSSSI